MSIWNAIIQGIIQGLTEFLPVSSSGHLSVFQYFSGQSGSDAQLFSILLHLGTLLAVFIAFHKTILGLIVEFVHMIRDIIRRKFSLADMNPRRRMILLLIVSMFPMIITVILKDWFAGFAADNSILAEGVCFVITSVLLFIADRCVHGRKTAADMKIRDAVIIGLMQAIAPLPGISRSGATIAAGLIVGLDRRYAVSFSFIMGIPAVLGANILELGDALKQGSLGISGTNMAVGLLCALVFGLLAIWMVNWLVTSNRFRIFAWYTFLLGFLVILIAVFELYTDHAFQRLVASLMEMGPLV